MMSGNGWYSGVYDGRAPAGTSAMRRARAFVGNPQRTRITGKLMIELLLLTPHGVSDHRAGTQSGDVFGGVADIRQDLFRVFADLRRRSVDAARSLRELHRQADDGGGSWQTFVSPHRSKERHRCDLRI